MFLHEVVLVEQTLLVVGHVGVVFGGAFMALAGLKVALQEGKSPQVVSFGLVHKIVYSAF